MLPALTGGGARNITRQNNSETSGFDRGRCVLTSSCRNTALAAAWIDQMYAPLQSPQNNWGSYGEKDSFNIFELSTNKDGGEMLKHLDLGDQSPVEVRGAVCQFIRLQFSMSIMMCMSHSRRMLNGVWTICMKHI